MTLDEIRTCLPPGFNVMRDGDEIHFTTTSDGKPYELMVRANTPFSELSLRSAIHACHRFAEGQR